MSLNIILMIMLYIWYINFNHPNVKSFEYKDIEHKAKTGDIILFHGLDNTISLAIGSYYSHIGIVYVDSNSNKSYIFEAFNYKSMQFYPAEYSRGIVLSDLKHRLNTYRGYCFYKELNKPIQCEALNYGFKNFIKYALNHMYYDLNIISSGIGKILCNNSILRGVNCGELTYLSLIKLGLLPYDYIYKNRKHHVLWLSQLNSLPNTHLSNGFYYKSPVYVLSNYFDG